MQAARSLGAALSFLTVIPIARRVTFDVDDVARSAVAFPFVGAAIGGAVGAAAYGLAQVLPSLAAAGVALALGAILTGGLHLDALADAADALGARTRDAALDVMRDSRLGSFGAVALALDLLVKAAVLAALAGEVSVVAAATAAGALSRSTAPALAAALPPARADGSGAPLARRTGAVAAAGAGVSAVVLALALLGSEGVAAAAAAAAAACVVGLVASRRFGGATGDVFGAAIELSETAALATAAALLA